MEKIIYPHEHITIDLSGPKKDDDCRLDDFSATKKELLKLRSLGVSHIIDQTCRGMGRNPSYIKEMAKDTGIEILSATGYYKEPFLPKECFSLDEKALAKIMIDELTTGMEDSEICASHIGEIGSSKDIITETEAKIFRAAARAHNETGAPICTHTTLGSMSGGQVKILLEDFSCAPEKIVISHLDLAEKFDDLLFVLDKGLNIAFDTIGKIRYREDSLRADWLMELIKRGYSAQILLSVDLTRKSHYAAAGGIGYAYLLEHFIPLLREKGAGAEDLNRMLCENPRRIYLPA